VASIDEGLMVPAYRSGFHLMGSAAASAPNSRGERGATTSVGTSWSISFSMTLRYSNQLPHFLPLNFMAAAQW
jgi:hypothetical protein